MSLRTPGFPDQVDHSLTIVWHHANHTKFRILSCYGQLGNHIWSRLWSAWIHTSVWPRLWSAWNHEWSRLWLTWAHKCPRLWIAWNHKWNRRWQPWNHLWPILHCPTWLWAGGQFYNYRKPSRYIEFWEHSVCKFCGLM